MIEGFQLRQAIAPFQRCSNCNGKLVSVEKNTIAAQIPYYTRLYYDEFAQCQTCQQIYWKGAHYKRIQSLIDQIRCDRSA